MDDIGLPREIWEISGTPNFAYFHSGLESHLATCFRHEDRSGYGSFSNRRLV